MHSVMTSQGRVAAAPTSGESSVSVLKIFQINGKVWVRYIVIDKRLNFDATSEVWREGFTLGIIHVEKKKLRTCRFYGGGAVPFGTGECGYDHRRF